MLKCVSQPQLERFRRSESILAAAANDVQHHRASLTGGLRSTSGSTTCLKDCVLESLTNDSGNGGDIGSKVEQAMDLVKSHLMFAVREEIESLKEQLKILQVRNGLLEEENALLRAHASPETLGQLQQLLGGNTPSGNDCQT